MVDERLYASLVIIIFWLVTVWLVLIMLEIRKMRRELEKELMMIM